MDRKRQRRLDIGMESAIVAGIVNGIVVNIDKQFFIYAFFIFNLGGMLSCVVSELKLECKGI